MSTSQLTCSQCSSQYNSFNTSRGIPSKICQNCREKQKKADEKRKDRVRNYQEEARRNIDHYWIDFCRRNKEKREKTVSLTQEQFNKLVTSPCFYCGYSNEKEIVGIDRIDNEKEYSLENCVPACKFCNRAKHILHPIFFIKKCEIISKYQSNTLIDSERETFYNEWKEYIHKSPIPYIYIKRNTEKKRGLPFHLTKEQYEEIIYKPCYLCGYKNRNGNGLDRIDNSKREYTYDNILSCCSTCNMMKAHFTKEDFLQGLQKIYIYCKYIPESWKLIKRNGFCMGGAKTEKIIEEKTEKQWRSKTIYKAVKSETIDDFKKKVLEQTKWADEVFQKETHTLFEKIKNSSFESVEEELQKLVAKIRYTRLGRC